MSKKLCEICNDNLYQGKYGEHLKSRHKKVWGIRHLIKNVVKTFSEKELEEVKNLVLEIKQRTNSSLNNPLEKDQQK